MKHLKLLFVILFFLMISFSARAHQDERMFVSDTLSGLSRAKMYYAMAKDESDPFERWRLCRLTLMQYDEVDRSGVTMSLADELDVCVNRSVCLAVIDSLAPIHTILQTAIDKVVDRYGTQSIEYAGFLRRVAAVYGEAGDHVQEKYLLDECAEIARHFCDGEYDGFSLQEYQMYMYCKARNESSSGQFVKAYKTARECHDMLTVKNEKGDSVIYMANLGLLSDLCEAMGRYGKMKKYQSMASAEYKKMLLERFEKMSEVRRSLFWSKSSGYFDVMLSTLDVTPLEGAAYDALLFSKGLLLNTSMNFRKHVETSGCQEAVEMLERMDSLVGAGSDIMQIDSLDLSIMRKLESVGKGWTSEVDQTRWQDVRDALGKDDLAIEFFRKSNGEYGALLIRKGWKLPKSVRLKDPQNLKRFRKCFAADTTGVVPQPFHEFVLDNAEMCSRKIWHRKILRHFPLTDEGKIFYSPDGQLHHFGIEYLPAFPGRKKDGSTMMDNYRIYRLSSTREIVERKDSLKIDNSASIYGGAMFNPPQAYLQYAVSTVSQIDTGMVDTVYERMLASMSVEDDGRDASSGEYIDPLPKTVNEVHEIDDVLKQNGADSRLYTGVYANEEAFKSKTSGRGIIHVATHGYYLTTSQALNSNEYYKSRFSHNPSVLSDPLYRSGFHLSGAAPAWSGLSNYKGLEDGVVTAKEISLLDLSKADLVVLSACQTGLGEVSRDGVYGLQRAFKKAGAKSIIMSMWKVHDKATYMMMSNFYRNRFVLGMSKYDAFQLAQRQLREKYPDAFYWQAFVLLDPEI